MSETDARDGDQVTARLDRLNEACRAAPQEIEPQIALWSAICSLDEWVFVNRGTAEQPRPYALAAEAGHLVCIYSTPERARAGAIANGLVAEGEAVPMFSTPLPAALDWVLGLAGAGVSGATVDYPQLGAWTPLPNLARFRQN